MGHRPSTKEEGNKNASEKAFLSAFDAYADALYRHAFFRLSDTEKAKDALQETFTKTWDFIVKGNVVENFRPFLYQTLGRIIIDEYRKKTHTSLDAFLEEEGEKENVFLSEERRDEKEMREYALDSKDVLLLLEELPEHYRTIIILRYSDGLSPQEISTLLSLPSNTVSVRIHRALALLKKIYFKREKEMTKKS
jgi:RNA polymerase sigma-70 factor, ECF subfamily